ncbi:LamG domain-containing protein, partial [Candidatus Woesearchaeota archaeon]|nr:LamG domain-containing protein [Candidatus Woesearchaeota archaeon]
DRSRYGNDGYEYNGVNCSTSDLGRFGTGCVFDGINDYIEINNSATLNASNQTFTITSWINLSDTSTHILYTRWNQDLTDRVWAVMSDAGFTFSNSTTGADFSVNLVTLGPAFSAGTWYHTAVVFNGTNVTGYVNGVNTGSGKVVLRNSTGNTGLRLGRDWNGGLGTSFKGSMDEVRMWSRVLSPAEINASYQAELGRVSGTTLSYFANFTNLNEGNYTYFVYANDTAGNFNSTVNRNFIVDYTKPTLAYAAPTDLDNATVGVLRNYTYVNFTILNTNSPVDTVIVNWNGTNVTIDDPTLLLSLHFENNTNDSSRYNVVLAQSGGVNCTTNVVGKFGKGCEFDGADDQLSLSITNNVLNITTNFSVMFWVKGSTIQNNGGGFYDPISFSHNSSAGWVFQGSGTSLAWMAGDVTSLEGITLSNNLTDGVWHQVTATINNISGRKLYIDGKLDGTGTKTYIRFINGATFYIGRDSNTRNYNGTFDEIRIWNRTLTEAEINASYRAELGRYYANFTNLAEGNYTYFVYANDTAGNFNSTVNRNFIVDYTKPAPAFIAPTDPDNATVNFLRNYTYVNISASDSASPPDSVIVNWNGTNVTIDDPSLVLAYDFNNNTNDRSRYGNNGMNYNGANCSINVTGKFGYGCEFSPAQGAGANISAGDNRTLSLNSSLTIMAWVYPKSGGSSDAGILGTGISGYQINLHWNGANQIVYFYIDGGGNAASTTTNTFNKWMHLAGTWDGTTGANGMKIYVNGAQAAQRTSTSSNIRLFSGFTVGSSSTIFNGTIDEVRVWNRSLTSAEINASYQAELGRYFANFTNLAEGNYTYFVWMNDTAGNFNSTVNRNLVTDYTSPNITFISPTPANNSFLNTNWVYINTSSNDSSNNDYSAFIDFNRSLVGWWRLEEGSDVVVNDSSTYNNNGTLANFACTNENCNSNSGRISAGRRGRGIALDGSDDYINLSNSTIFNFGNDFTASMWVKAPSSQTQKMILTKGQNYLGHGGTPKSWGIYTDGSSSVSIYMGDGTAASIPVSASAGFTANTWTHIVMAVNRTGNMSLYMDGQMKATSIISQLGSISTGDPLLLGVDYDGAGLNLQATVDEITIWNRLLASTEINASFNAGKYRLENNYTGLADGNYSYAAYAVDRAGNIMNTGTYGNFTVDTVRPTPVFVVPTDSDNTTVGVLRNYTYINITYSDASPLDTAIVNWNGTNVTVDDPSLVLALDFNNNTNDRSRYGNNGRNFGGNCSLDATGKFRTACRFFNSTANYISFGNSSSLQSPGLTQRITVMAWIKFNMQLKQFDSYQQVLAGSNSGSGHYGFIIASTAPPTLRFFVNESGGATSATSTYPNNEWHHYAGTYDGATERLYVDGVLVASTDYGGGIANLTTYNISINEQGSTGIYFDGSIDEIRIWNRNLSNAEINASYQAELGRVSGTTLSYFANFTNLAEGNYTYFVWMNDTAGNFNSTVNRNFIVDYTKPAPAFIAPTDADNTTVGVVRNYTYVNISPSDSSSRLDTLIINWNGTNVTIDDPTLLLALDFNNNTVDWSRYKNSVTNANTNCTTDVSGRFGGACYFDTTTSNLTVAHNSILNIENFTYSVWINPDAVGVHAPILTKGPSLGQGTQYGGSMELRITSVPSGSILVNIQNDSNIATSQWGYNSIGGVVSVGVWQHVAVTKLGNNFSVYYNGLIINSTTFLGQVQFNTQPLLIGTRMDNYKHFGGFIDELRIWNRSLTGAEIAASYQSGRYFANISNLKEGNYTYFVWANDTAGNFNSTVNRNFIVDYTKPTLAYAAPTDLDNATVGVLRNYTYVNFTVLNTNSPVDTVIVNWNGTNVTIDDPSLVLALDFNNNTNDRSRYGISVTNNGANCSSAIAGKFGGACQFGFNGVQTSLNLSTNTVLDLRNSTTISIWVKPDSAISEQGQQMLIGKSPNQFRLYYDDRTGSQGRIIFHMNGGNTSQRVTTGSGTDISNNVWSNIGITYDRTNLKLYINGILISSQAQDQPINSNQGVPVLVGYQPPEGDFFNGTIDEVRIWNRSLSAAEINASYQAELGRYFANFTNLNEGNYTYFVWANDTAGNFNSTVNRNFIVDYTKPAPAFIAPTDADNATVGLVRNYTYVNISPSDSASPPDSVIVNWNGTNVTIVDPSLVLALDLNNNTNDRSRYANSVTNTGGNCSTLINGKFGGGCSFSTTNQYLDITAASFPNPTTVITIMAWVNVTSNYDWQRVVARSDWVSAGKNSWLLYIDSAGNAKFAVSNGTTQYNANTGNGIITTNTWHQLTGVFNGTHVMIYADGTLKATTQASLTTNNITLSSLSYLRVSDTTGASLNGTADEIRIWNRSLSYAEINASYQAELGRYFANFTNLNEGNYTYFVYMNDTAGNFNSTVNRNFIVDYTKPTIAFVSPADADNTTVGLLRNYTYVNFTILNTNSPVDTVIVNWNGTNVTIDDPSLVLALDFNNNTNDRSRYGNNGVNGGANCSATVSGRFGGACKFDGTSSVIDASNSTALRSLNAMTVSAWFNGGSQTAANPIIIGKWSNSAGPTGNKFHFGIYSGNNFRFTAVVGSTQAVANGSSNYTDNTWHNAVGVYDGAAVKLYVDGNLINSTVLTGTLNFGANDLAIGGSVNTTSPTDYFTGFIDEVRIWNRTLSAAEINASYRAELGRINGTTLSYFANFTNLAEGNYTYFVYANDTAGNFNSTVNRNFVVDYTKPTIAFVSPADNDNTT